MTPEIALLRQRLAANEELVVALTIGLDCDIDEMRSICDKYETKVDLKSERMMLIADRINNQRNQLRKLEAEIKNLKKDLGGTL